jgi:riboflavin synthase alpha subunit
VLWKSQLEKAIAWLIEREFEFSWEVKVGDSITPNTYTLTVHDIPWADNLKQFAKVLEKCDFQSDI